MKKIIFCFFIFLHFTTQAQLIYLGDDVIQKNTDGYSNSMRTKGLVMLDNKMLFITPNGNFYSTDGTEENTKIVKQFPPQDIAYFNATNKYVYFTYNFNSRDIVKDLVRYNAATGISVVRNTNSNYQMLQLNHMVVPNQKFLVDEVFTSYDKNDFLIRKFTNNNFYLYIVNDFNDNANANLVYTQKLNDNYITTPIGTNTEIETLNGMVFINGRERPTGTYQTTVNVFEKDPGTNLSYKLKANFSLLKNHMYPYYRFLRTEKNIYSLIKEVDSVTNAKKHRLWYYEGKNIKATAATLNLPTEDAETQMLNGEIHVSSKGILMKYVEAGATYKVLIDESEKQVNDWQNIDKNIRFLKIKDNYLYRRDNKLFVKNTVSNIVNELPGSGDFTLTENNFTMDKVYAYATTRSFYYTQNLNNKLSFVRYNVSTQTTSAIEFPAFKKQEFETIKAIHHCDNKFIILAKYTGKKGKAIYKMFIYTEEGESLANKNDRIIPVIVKTEPKQETKSFDIKTFNKKLFVEQLIKILNNQSNQFNDITAESIPSELSPKYKSTINLEGFGEGVIIDYKRDSYLMRYEAVSVVLKGKLNGLAFLDLLDSEVQKLVANNGITRVIDVDVKVRKRLDYLNTDGNKLLQLDLYCPTDFTNPEEAVFTLTIRADKRTK